MKMGTRLSIGFGGVIALTILVGGIGVNRMNLLSSLTEKLYLHPMAVSNAVRDIKMDIIAMHRSMKDVVLARSEAQIESAVETVDEYEQDVFKHFAVLEERYLGDQSKVQKLETTFSEWKSIRDQVIALILVRKMESAADITMGKGAKHISLLLEEIQGFIEFSESKGDEFYENAIATRDSADLTMYIFMGASILIGGCISFFMARSITRPVHQMSVAAEGIATGDYSVTVESTGKDEIAALGRSFSYMIEKLKLADEQRVKISEVSTTVSSTAEELSTSCAQMKSSLDETSLKTNSLANTSNQTSENVSSVAAAAEEMSATVHEISKNVQEATRITAEAVEIAQAMNKTIKNLDESSTSIGEVVKVINSIAEQTNLLALNATIEAARAGDAGKGFSVVANEVKDLANATAKATAEISNKVQSIQHSTKEAVESITRIGEVVGKTNEISLTIAGAVEEQATTTNEISQSMAQAAKGTKEVNESIDGILKATHTTGEGTENLLKVSGGLSEISGVLLKLVKNSA